MRFKFIAGILLACSFSCTEQKTISADRPNILWIIVEDMSSHFGYQGENLVFTPNVDRLAAEGVTFTNAYVTAPVCSASRSALITGRYQTSIGVHHHRSSRGEEQIHLPAGLKTIPELFRQAGYYTTNSQEQYDKKGKEDYNFNYNSGTLYDETDWAGRTDGQPFFAQIQLRGGKLRNVPRWYEEVRTGLKADVLVQADAVKLPPYYPDHPAFRKDWAAYLNTVSYTDLEVGRILDRLQKEGLTENTVVFFITDHGLSQARGKQFLYEEGTHIPFIIWAPKRIEPQIRQDLISHIDMAATSLQLAGIDLPEQLDAQSLLDENYKARPYIVSARDRCDETVDRIRSLRRGDFKYIRNFYPERPYLQACAYKDQKPWMPVLKTLDEQGALEPSQQLITADSRPEEELYLLTADPHELNNLANDEEYLEILTELRATLEAWIRETGDAGQSPEPDAMYDSDMQVYLENVRRRNPENAKVIEENIAIMKAWAASGK